MDFLKANAIKIVTALLLAVLIIAAALNIDLTKRLVAQGGDLLSKAWASASAMLHPASATSPADTATGSSAPDSTACTQAQSAVEAYMHKYAAPQSTLTFLDWSDFSASGQSSAITLHYSVQQPTRPVVLASVRFTLQGGAVLKAELAQAPLQAAAFPSGPSASTGPATFAPRPRPTPPPVVIDHFSGPIFRAQNAGPMTLQLSDAFSLSQLEQAKQKAIAERKPLGFIMVWGKIFGFDVDTRGGGSDSALVHFYQVFNDKLVLVFVRHETELGSVPPAVAQGFRGPDEGGFSPNMAVTDASCSEFIVEIPYRDLNGEGRDQIFAQDGHIIDQWLATHPDAMATPSP